MTIQKLYKNVENIFSKNFTAAKYHIILNIISHMLYIYDVVMYTFVRARASYVCARVGACVLARVCVCVVGELTR